ncbi:MAG: YbaK/EbsC family protein [SAR324 cluster bacterium]|uniref:YbaK/EbsC family protein n=1 Tax=SAR324 cluster bacterium TaxID=2024889 RepID=A0A7X9IIU9_9DELT|nr:YbaK/EbsC family protein [SAR324 cluster bacterium]
MRDTSELYQRSKQQLDAAGNYSEFEHEPVLDYTAAAVVRDRFGLTGTETKSLFLRSKGGLSCMLVTVETKRADFGKIKEVLGERVLIASDKELQEQTGCKPMCAVPFGLPESIVILIDKELFSHRNLIFSPGPPERTVEMNIDAVKVVINGLPNRVEYV